MDSTRHGLSDGSFSGRRDNRIQRCFVVSAGIILALTGTAKVFTVTGDTSLLDVRDPIFGIAFRHLMLLVGLTEMVIAGGCLFARMWNLSTALIAAIASGFLAYRVGVWVTGWEKPCGCLGNLTDVLGISPRAADFVVVVLLGYLLLGAYYLMFSQLRDSSLVGRIRTDSG